MTAEPQHAPLDANDAPAAPAGPPALRATTREALRAWVVERGWLAFRADQVYQWIFRHGVESLDEMRNVPADLRAALARETRLGGVRPLEVQGAPDRTQKIVFELHDGRVVESVVMRDLDKGRTGLCISSQVGCAVGCTFCLTGYGGFQRHCAADEIVGQALAVRRHFLREGEALHSIVFMGMGEPLLNVGPVVEAVRLLADPEGMAISPRRITVSTSGIVPGIEAFGRAATGANLAVSLNATTDAARERIMPINRRWPIATLIEALGRFPLAARRRITVEYVLMRGVNDADEDAERLTRLLRPLRCKVNLIMFNPHEYLDFEPVDEAVLERFARRLAAAGYTVSVRWSKGREIEAACGQLAAHYLREQAAQASPPV